jgi:hypothetical protein
VIFAAEGDFLLLFSAGAIILIPDYSLISSELIEVKDNVLNTIPKLPRAK